MSGHVVVAGFGRVGGFVAGMLDRLEQKFVIVESSPRKAEEARDAGYPVVFGEASAEPVLEAADAARARLVVLTVPDALDARTVVERVRRISPEVHIVARSSSAEQLQDFGRLGVYETVQPEFEAALELGRQALVHLGIGAGEIQRFSDQVRGELYAPIVGGSDDGLLDQLRRAARMIETEWFRLPDGSPVIEHSIGELQIRNTVGASVVAVVRGEEVIASPGPEVVFQPGDTAVVLGSREQRLSFREMVEGVAVGSASGKTDAAGNGGR